MQMQITDAKIDRFCRWHIKNGGWGLQLAVIKEYLIRMPNSEAIKKQIEKIDYALQ